MFALERRRVGARFPTVVRHLAEVRLARAGEARARGERLVHEQIVVVV